MLNQFDTPGLLIEKSKMINNLNRFQSIASRSGIKLRPHIKTHKTPELAALQLNLGASGIATAKISEAEIMAEHNIKDIQIANIIIGEYKLKKLFLLNQKIDSLSCCVDSYTGVEQLSKIFVDVHKKLNIFIKINTGFDRLGINDYNTILRLCNNVISSPGLNFKGLLTHAGHVYAAKNIGEVRTIGINEGQTIVKIAEKLKTDGIACEEISVGSTPSAKFCTSVNGVTELRAGNYIFNDMIQVALGSADIENCALSVVAQVISIFNNRAILDAGSKALGLDLGAHSNKLLDSYGYIMNKNARITRLSEEHAIIEFIDEVFSIGEKIRIVPNHACAVMNLFDYVYLVDGEQIIDKLEIKARGKMQ